MLEIDSSGVKVASGNLKKFTEEANKSAKSATFFDDVMNNFNMTAIASTAGVLGLVKAVQGLANGLKGTLSNFAHFESMQKGLETFFQSADMGKQKFEELRKLSNSTTFGVDELANSFTQLANVGAPVDEINDQLVMLGNLSSGDKQRFAELVSIYSKVLSVGKAGGLQLQQIATKGIPIYDILKKMGVQGSASAKQITEAFKQMTSEGGQFYNAMNNINDTIEGKEGFISDYFKEFTVNFAEASGIADAYKAVLDVVSEALGNVSDWLLKISENPVYKSIFQGVITAMLAGLATQISVGLVKGIIKIITQLKAVNKELTIMNILKGPAGWAALAVAGVVGVTTTVIGLTKRLSESKKEAKELAEAMKGMGGSGHSDEGGFTGHKYSNTDELARQYRIRDEREKQLEEANRWLSVLKYYNTPSSNKVFVEQEALIASLIQAQSATNLYILELEKLAEAEMKAAEEAENYKNYMDMVNEAYDNLASVKARKEIIDLENNIKSLKNSAEHFRLTLQPDDKMKIQAVLDDWKKQCENMKIKFAVDSQNDWQKTLSKVLGFSDEQIASLVGKGYNGFSAGEMYKDNRNFSQQRTNDAYKLMGYTPSNETKQQSAIDDFNDLKEKVLTLMQDKDFNPEDNIFKSLTAQLKDAEKGVEKFGLAVNKNGDIVNINVDFFTKLKNELNDLGDKMKESGANFSDILQYTGLTLVDTFTSASGDLDNFVQGFQFGNIWGGIIATVVGALMNVCRGIDNFDEVLNPVTTIIGNLGELIYFIMSIISDLLKVIKAIAKVINTLLSLLRPLLTVITTIFNLIGEFADAIAGACDWLLDFLGIEQRKVEEEETVDLTDAYKSLLEAMKANEEEYEKRKKELNASDYASKVTGVHDMILTPQGQFSTDPDDYIIATKNPNGLGTSGFSVIQLQPIINNTIADSASVSASTETDENGMARLIVTVSRKVASDYASGQNGWDSAISSRTSRQSGKSLAL